MKTIIALTDFSDGSANAAKYAAEVAKMAGTRMVLLHVNILPAVGVETPGVFMQLDYSDAAGIEAVGKEAEHLKQLYGTELQVEGAHINGYSITEMVTEYLHTHPADLLVAGMTGSGFVREKLIGSTATSLIRHCKVPVLVIQQGTRFSPPKHILFAYDAGRKPEEEKYDFLEEFAQLFGAKLTILNVFNGAKQELNVRQASGSGIVEDSLRQTRHAYHFIESDDIAGTVSHFAMDKQADIIVTMPGKHSFLDVLMHEGNTRRIAFHTSLPLLAIQ